MGSKQRIRKGGQGFGNIKPVSLSAPVAREGARPAREDSAEEVRKDGASGALGQADGTAPTLLSASGPPRRAPPYPLEVMLRTHFLQLWNSRSSLIT